MIRTTVNMTREVYEMICSVSRKSGMSKTTVIKILLRKISTKEKRVKMWKRIEYQKRNSSQEWQTFHLSIEEAEYEYYLDLRKLLKKSLSLIIFIAANEFIEIVNTTLSDNYPFFNYIITSSETTFGIQKWSVYWGIPEEIILS
jgi:hypothetical protein